MRLLRPLVLSILAGALVVLLAPSLAMADGPSASTPYLISGQVIGSDTGQGVPGICVTASPVQPPNPGYGPPIGQPYNTTTGSGGYYQLWVSDQPIASYYVTFTDCRSDPVYTPQAWQNSPPNQATPVTIGPTNPAAVGIDGDLQVGGWIVGKVTDARSGAPLAGIEVLGPGFATTNSAGHYKIGPLYTGSYRLEYIQPSSPPANPVYASELYDQQPPQGTGNPISVTAPNTVQVNEPMSVGGVITGRVTNAVTGAPLGGETVSTNGPSGGNYTYTAADGTYQITGLFAGSYTVAFFGGNYTEQWWQDETSPSLANSIAVQFYGTTPGIDAALMPS